MSQRRAVLLAIASTPRQIDGGAMIIDVKRWMCLKHGSGIQPSSA